MSYKLRLTMLLIVTVFPGLVLANALPLNPIDLPMLTHDADLIVVGQVISIKEEELTAITIDEQGNSMRARRMSATLRVNRVLKGQYDKQMLRFAFFITEFPAGYKSIPAGQFGMFFLRETSYSEYSALNPQYPFVVASLAAPVLEGTLLDHVVAEVAQVLVSRRTSLDERKQALSVLFNVRTKAATAVLRRAAKEQDAPLRLLAAAALLSRNDISVLNMVEDALLHPPQSVSRGQLQSLSFVLRDQVKDPRAIPSLARLLSSRDVYTRRGTASALRHTGVADAIEPLTTALRDSDREVRYYAVMGLAEITGQNEWGPSLDLFERAEQRYLAHWREWASKKQ